MLYFPPNPIEGQRYVAINGVTYTWLGNRWNSSQAIEEGVAEYYVDNGDAFFNYDPDVDVELDGGDAMFGFSLQRFLWKRDLPDARDHIYTAQVTSLPVTVDLRSYASAIEDQGNLGSCTGNAIAGAIELIDRKKINKALEISRLFIYYQERVLEGTIYYDSGAYIRDGFKAVNKWGAPLENLWPYSISKWATKPSVAAYTDALKRRVTAYQRCINFTAVKSALAAGQPVVIGFDVYESFENISSDGIMTYPNTTTEEYLGGHAVCLVGYNDNTQRFIARNSWGTGWGDQGYFYMPYQVIKNTSMSSDFWTMSSVTNP